MKKFCLLFCLIVTAALSFADTPGLLVLQDDIVVEQHGSDWRKDGVDLYIRKKSSMESVMLVETTKDPDGKSDNFAYRAKEYNSVNGDEIRYLNGKVLTSEYAKYSLISSTVVHHEKLGKCFHIYIPSELEYGYPWERHGTVSIEQGLFINIRTFSKKYGDYTGKFQDNPFMFDTRDFDRVVKTERKVKTARPKPRTQTPPPEPVTKEPEPHVDTSAVPEEVAEPEPLPVEEPEPEPLRYEPEEEEAPPEPEPVEPEEPEPVWIEDEEEEPPEPEYTEPEDEPVVPPITLTDDYNLDAAQKFNEIANKAGGMMTYSKGPETLPDDLGKIIQSFRSRNMVDIVLAIDTTGSMRDDLDSLRNEWIPRVLQQLEEFNDVRIGLLCYRDYFDNYKFENLPVKIFGFTSSEAQLKEYLDTIKIRGNEGGDIPEAVYEALYAGLYYYDWRDEAEKKIILIGDAGPHKRPRGKRKITQDMVINLANEKHISLDCVIVPDDKSSSRGR
ncbi:MAG: VWA domain-containing protein [Treponema sp.]|nr:VWA domain-containing protein [Treponema sp.]